MRVEVRADGVHISGYVNVPGRASRPVITPHGRVIETIEQGAFKNALAKAGDELRMLMDHNSARQLASIADGTLTAREDAIGLYAEATVSDPEVVEAAKKHELRGWSFNMRNVQDELEQRAEGLPLRKVKSFDMSEISLILHAVPCYSATSVEVRADGTDADTELRALGDTEFIIPEEKQQSKKEKIRATNAERRAQMEALINACNNK